MTPFVPAHSTSSRRKDQSHESSPSGTTPQEEEPSRRCSQLLLATMSISKRLSLFQFISLTLLCHFSIAEHVAVIGGGISGTFVTRYLVDYDQDCKIDSLTLYDPNPLGEYVTKQSSKNDPSWQGSRVATLKLDDGRLVELGASILSEKFKFVKEMANAGNLTLSLPFQTGFLEPDLNTGFSIYNGNGQNLLNTANMTSFWKKFSMAWRYNIELYLVSRAMQDFIRRFEIIQEQLDDRDGAFFNSPDEMWKSVGLDLAVQMSLSEYCRHLWVPETLPWWRRLFMYGQGSLQEELLSGINLVNYNQDNAAINALSGLASFSVVSVPTYGISGGNIKLVSSAWYQAQQSRYARCGTMTTNATSNRHVRERVSTIVGSLEGFELFGENGRLLGSYDIVILATPMSMSKIDFLVQSHVDPSVLQPMPLGKLITVDEDSTIPDDHEGHSLLPRRLPPSVSRPYTQVVTTIVRNGTLQIGYFSIDEQHIPKGIYMTPKGKDSVYNVTAISQISAQEGLYKVFSSQSLPPEALVAVFGPKVYIEYEKVWGGPHGGATPDYRGRGESTEFLLYDGATGFHGHTKSGALYYTNSLELSLACIETSAMGAKAVAKLIARRLGWLTTQDNGFGFGDEL